MRRPTLCRPARGDVRGLRLCWLGAGRQTRGFAASMPEQLLVAKTHCLRCCSPKLSSHNTGVYYMMRLLHHGNLVQCQFLLQLGCAWQAGRVPRPRWLCPVRHDCTCPSGSRLQQRPGAVRQSKASANTGSLLKSLNSSYHNVGIYWVLPPPSNSLY